MNIKRKILSVATSVALVLGLCPASALADDTSLEPTSTKPVVRINGETAAETSAAISGATFTSSEWVVLARDDDFADAMSATGLAGALGAPIVLTDRYGLSGEARSEIDRLGASNCYIIGGTGAMPGRFEADLGAMGVTAARLFGESAADTSVACANKIAGLKQGAGQPLDKAIVAMSVNFQDALSISSFAYAYGAPIFLQTEGATATDRSLTPEAQRQLTGAWSGAQVYVPGGVGALSEASVEGVVGATRTIRMYGETGYNTSAAIADRLTTDGLLSAENVYFACGAQAPKGLDALSGAALAGKNKGVMLLTNTNTAIEPINTTTQYGFFLNNASVAKSATIFGGSYVVPDAQKDTIKNILETPSSAYSDILLGSFFSDVWMPEKNSMGFATTVFGSVDTNTNDGIVMHGLNTCPPNNNGNSGLHDPSIIYKDGYFWMLSGMNRWDGKFWPMISYSKDLVNWTSPEGDGLINGTHGVSLDSMPAGKNGWGFDTVAPEWFVDDDGTVYIVVSCGYYGDFHGEPTVDTMTPYIIKVNQLSANAPVSKCPDGIYYWPSNLTFQAETAQRLTSVVNRCGGEADANIIDSSLYKENGTYYLTVKNRGLSNETFTSTTPMANNWSYMCNLSYGYEGPSIAKFGGQYLLFGDKVQGATALGVDYASAGSITYMDNWRTPTFLDCNGIFMRVRHGSVITLSEGTPGWQQVWDLMVQKGVIE